MTNYIYQGSVKNLIKVDEQTCDFEFSNRYSIFDWGEMPDLLEDKGIALASMGADFFHFIKSPSHFISQEKNFMRVRKVQVPTITNQNYSFYQNSPSNCLVPLELIFRFGLPEGSSYLKRFEGFRENQIFKKPLIDFSTKLEKQDRYLTKQEAQRIAGLSDKELSRLEDFVAEVAFQIKELTDAIDTFVWDGKIEVAFDKNRNFILVDTIGLDELRVSYHGKVLSKQALRDFYKGTSWYQDLMLAQQNAGPDFKEYFLTHFQSSPEKLPLEFKAKAEYMYKAFANEIHYQVHQKYLFSDKFTLKAWERL